MKHSSGASLCPPSNVEAVRVMIDLATAAVIAKTTSDAVGAFDKIFRGFADFLKKKEPSGTHIPPPDFAYVNDPEHNAFVAKSRRTGNVYQTVTYDQLCCKLQGSHRGITRADWSQVRCTTSNRLNSNKGAKSRYGVTARKGKYSVNGILPLSSTTPRCY
jgi:hypothetical protein